VFQTKDLHHLELDPVGAAPISGAWEGFPRFAGLPHWTKETADWNCQHLTVLTYLSTVPEKPFPCFFTRCSQSNGKTRKKKERYFCQPGPGPIDSLKLGEAGHQKYLNPPTKQHPTAHLQSGCLICSPGAGFASATAASGSCPGSHFE